MDAELNERMERMERTQRELQEQLAKSQQEARDLMGPMQSPDIVEPPQSRANQDPLYPLGFTPPHAHTMQRGYPQREPTGLEQHPAPSVHLGQGMFVSNPVANPSDPIVPDLDDPVEVARLRIDNAQDKYRILEERIKVVEGAEVFSALSAKELSLVPDLVLPPKFKALDFEKYDGTRCPKAHLIMFCRKMTGYVNDDKLLVHCFQDSFVGSALRWYNQLSRERIRSWKDLASAFYEQYRHVSDMVPDRLTLQMMENKPTETFRQYAQRWRDISAQVEPPLTKTEITVLFINTLKAPFYDKLVGSATKDFADIVIFGELIENAVKSERIEGPESSKRVVPAKKKEAEAHMVGTESQCTPNSYPTQSRHHYRPPSNFYFPPQGPYYQAPPSYPVYAMNNQRPFTVFPPNTVPTQTQPKNEQRPARPNSCIIWRIIPEAVRKTINIFTLCGTPEAPIPEVGHCTENCLAFKKRVQGFIDAGILRFDGVSNVTRNPLPNHIGGNVNAVTNEGDWRAKSYVIEVRTPLRKVWEMMVEKGLLCLSNRIIKEKSRKDQCLYDFHGVEGHDIQSCKEFRKLLQDMMDNNEVKVFDRIEGAEEGEICASDNQSMAFPYSVDRPLVIYYEAKREEVSQEVKPSLIIEVPAPFSYKDNKAVPWKYDVNIVVPEGEKSKVMNEDVSGVGHFSRSGRCYSPETVEPKKKVAGPSQKGKAPMYEAEDDVETQLEQEVKKAVNEEEAHEFLKFIKHSEYSVVE
ncbi:uncharacterized protein [Gossypium hirsutum]|uniref:Retrotransposon gag domain-containing protein n=1 Tax=Gossypium hirsutum TaxID=3635 RepID=A0A1U8J7M5_GOSHI|nr:uncharacterized protein LOC107902558 [Gossypium hirsutum]